MNTRISLRRASLVVLLLTSFAAAQSAPPMPTMDDLIKMYDAKQYRTCLQQIARVIRQAQVPGGAWDKYALLLMRADCLLHLRDGASARQAYEAAEKAPTEEQWARARAMAFLISQSPGLKYTPRTAQGEPTDITEDANQPKAMNLLLTDELVAIQRDVRRVTTAQNMEPIQEFVPRLQDLYATELIVTGGKSAQVEPIVKEVSQAALGLVQRELNQVGQKMQNIQTSSTQPGGATMMGGSTDWWVDPGVVRRGLYPEERQWLREAGDYLNGVEQTAEKGQRMASKLGDQSTQWGAAVTQAQQLQQQAQAILENE